MPKKKPKKIVPIVETEIIEIDLTVHDLEKHSQIPLENGWGSSWYAHWGNKCPACGAFPTFEQKVVPVET